MATTATPTTTQVYQQAIPQELLPYVTQALGGAQSMVFGPNAPGYQVYGGQQVADFSPLQTQAFGNIQQMQPSAYTGQAAGLAGIAGTNQYTGANVNQYMSPYVSDVVNQQQQQAIRNYAQQLPGLASSATGMGGLGGSRQALMQANAQQGLQNQLANITATGYQNAFQNAQNQFNASNQNMLNAAGMLGNLGQQQFQQTAGINTALLGAGALQQQQQQQGLNNAYQKWLGGVNFPYQQLDWYMNMAKQAPTGSGTSSMYQAPPNLGAQIGGLASMGLGSFFGSGSFG
jgi:hypothetical protein